MAALNFPNSPSVNDIHTENGVSFKWNGTIWKKVGASYLDTTNLNVTGIGTFAGNVFINGVLTYEDVKNVDSVGIVTARTNIHVGADVVHLGDTDTKIGFTDNNIKLFTGGSSRLEANNSGVYVASGLPLAFYASSGHTPNIKSVGTNNNDLAFTLGNAEKIRITSTGLVGIGEDTPLSQLEIGGATNATFQISPADGNTGESRIFIGGNSTNQNKCAIIHDPAGGYCRGNLHFCLENSGDVSNVDSSDSKVVIMSDGSMGVGITPFSTGLFHVGGNIVLSSASNAPKIIFEEHSGTDPKAEIRMDQIGSADAQLQFYTEGGGTLSERFRIKNTGNIGIGTVNPQDYDGGAESLVVCGPGGTLGQSGITIVSGSDKYGCLYFADGTGSASYRGRVEYRHDIDVLQMGANGAHGDLVLDSSGNLFLRGDQQIRMVLGSSGSSGYPTDNNSNWIRGNSTNLEYNNAGGFHGWEISGSQKMKLSGSDLELVSASSVRITLGSQGTPGTNDCNWIRGDSNNLMFNCADTSGDHIWEIGGTAYAKINTAFGLKADNTCKVWLCYRSEAGNEGIQDAFGVASVTDESTGTFWINLDNNIHRHGNGFYQSIVFGSYNASPYPIIAAIGYAPSHGSNNPWWDVEDNGCRVNTQRSDTGAQLDAKVFSVAMFGDTGDLSPT